MIEDNKQKGIYFKSRGHFRLPDCESLSSHENKTQNADCSHTGLTDVKVDEITYTCIKEKGRFYQGPVNVTKAGIPCQRWDKQEPHSHNRPPNVFPEMWNSENNCRNAGGEEPVPWCYTMDPKVRWQHCDIPVCGEETYDQFLLSFQNFILSKGFKMRQFIFDEFSSLLLSLSVSWKNFSSSPLFLSSPFPDHIIFATLQYFITVSSCPASGTERIVKFSLPLPLGQFIILFSLSITFGSVLLSL